MLLQLGDGAMRRQLNVPVSKKGWWWMILLVKNLIVNEHMNLELP